jgi:Thiamine pyrophosphate enzyme, central domain
LTRTVADLLAAGLAALGVERVVGEPVPGITSVQVADAALADLLADVDGRLGRLGASWHDRVLRVTSRPGADPEPLVVDSAEALAAGLARTVGQQVPDAFALRVDLALDQPVSQGVEPLAAIARVDGLRLSPSLGPDVGVVVGPGVVRAGAVGHLQRFAAQTGWSVVNTWGAKGVFAWDSTFHGGTAGLQARDFELAGLTSVPLVVALGVDPDEWPPGGAGDAQRLDLHPTHLALAAEGWDPPVTDPRRPALYTELAALLAPAYESPAVPLHPARASGDLAGLRPEGGVVVADPGPAGLWVARTFRTVEPGSVLVPATRAPGTATAAAVLGGLGGRPALAVTTWPLDPTTVALLDLARQLELTVTVEAWGGEAELSRPEDRVTSTAAALARPGVDVIPVPVDFTATADLVAVAGEVVAWTGE